MVRTLHVAREAIVASLMVADHRRRLEVVPAVGVKLWSKVQSVESQGQMLLGSVAATDVVQSSYRRRVAQRL